MKHKLTKREGYVLGRKDLVGKTVDVELRKDSELPSDLKGHKIAKSVSYKGVKIGGVFALED